MTGQEAIRKLIELRGDDMDREAAHKEADQVLCCLLDSLGHGDVVTEWAKVDRRYV